jgi:dTDP-glucose pyrophosphorylase/CBS domain-containing protein
VKADITSLLITPSFTVREAMQKVEDGAKGAVLVVDVDGKLVGIITDGDIRRAVLNNVDLDKTVGETLLRSADGTTAPQPLTKLASTRRTELVDLITATRLRHIPLVDEDGRPVDLATMETVFEGAEQDMSALIMAGGFGNRLRPLTDNIPKPMLKVGDQPLLERIVEQLKDEKVHDINISTHYKHDTIADHFRDGESMGVNIRYLKETEPLGTAGILSRFTDTKRRMLVINGDILTKVSFRAMMAFHISHHSSLTVGCRLHEVTIPYGELEIQGVNVSGIREKPVHRYFVSAGIYIIEPDLLELIPDGMPYQMPELIEATLARGKQVVSFPITEYWRDIGHLDDFQQAVEDVGKWDEKKTT